MSITQKIVESIVGEQKTVDSIGVYICALCGGEKTVREWFEIGKTFSGNFTDFNQALAKNSNVICWFCKQAISDDFLDSPKGKRCGLRLYSFFVEIGEFKIIEMEEKHLYLFDYQFQQPFVFVLTQTGQKHISFKAQESYSNQNFWVCTENRNLWFERERWRTIFDKLNYCYQKRVTKDELLQGSIAPWKFNKYDLDFSIFAELRKHRNTEQYKLLVSILRKEKNENDSSSKNQSD